MPLTFAHPAIALPLKYLPSGWVSLTGLIVGSIAPDFEYFIRMKVLSIYSHTLAGLFWFNVPMGLLLIFIYHNLVRNAFLNNIPVVFSKRLAIFQNFNWNKYCRQNIAVVVISVFIGAASHLFWDSFTHAYGHFAMAWNMTAPVSVLGVKIPLYKIIQHCSTLIGGIIILVALLNMPVTSESKSKQIYPYWLALTGMAIIVVALRLLFGLNIKQYPDVIVSTLSGYILGAAIMPLFLKRVLGVNLKSFTNDF